MRGCLLWLGLFLAWPAPAQDPAIAPDPNPPKEPSPAKLSVSGHGPLGNRRLRKIIRQLLPGGRIPTSLQAPFIEDAALVLRNRLEGEGYLKAEMTVATTLGDGRVVSHRWGYGQELFIPFDVEATRVDFQIHKGPLHYYQDLRITGLLALSLAQGRGYFYKEDFLVPARKPRRFSPDRLKASLTNLQRTLHNLGYRDARVTAGDVTIQPDSGAVRVVVHVFQGPRYHADSVQVQVRSTALDRDPIRSDIRHPDVPYSEFWSQDLRQALARQEYSRGFADATVDLTVLGLRPLQDRIAVDLRADVTQGPPVQLGEVRFEGQEKTRLSYLQHKVRLDLDGPELDRLEVDAARERLARLGIFKFIEVTIEPDDGLTRDVLFHLEEGQRIHLDLILGYGSYDRAFGGFELNQYNLFGVGHNARLRAVQSFKSTEVDYTYTIPEFLVRDLSLFTSANGLRREESSFDREELILSIGTRKAFAGTGNQVGLRYAYEFLNAELAPAGVAEETPNEVAAFIIDGERDRLDNPLAPRKGYRVFGSLELANPALGGESEFQRLELAVSYHLTLPGGRYVHLAVSEGLDFSPNASTDLPFNKRFFPGGESSVRGYQRGEASPVNDLGQEIGAEAFTQWNIEFEQALTPLWSVVGFVDGVGIAERIQDAPWDEVLWSAGGGVRWNTIIGPVRLEYGHNLNPRPKDPNGTLHFSIGYPF